MTTGNDIARKIWEEEQILQKAILKDPLNTHLHGIMRGLHRARDIANGVVVLPQPEFMELLRDDSGSVLDDFAD